MKAFLALLLRVPVALVLAVGVVTLVSVSWFLPWVFTFHLGLLAYFPYEPDGVSRYARLAGPVTSAWGEDWVPGDAIPAACKKALVASEDAKFFYHNGLDLESMEKSYEANLKRGEIRRGGSTITQQLVKNAFLSRDKSYLRKLREVAGALLLDATLGKEDQLAWYFNLVEFGPRTYGIEAAARFYYKKEAAALSGRECAELVAILPSPNKWNASLVGKRPTAFFSKRVATIVARIDDVTLGTDEKVVRELAKGRGRLSISQSARLAADQVKDVKSADPRQGSEQGAEPVERDGANAGASGGFFEGAFPGGPTGDPVSPGADAGAGTGAGAGAGTGAAGTSAGDGAFPGEGGSNDEELPAETPALPAGLLPDRDQAPPGGPAEPVEATEPEVPPLDRSSPPKNP